MRQGNQKKNVTAFALISLAKPLTDEFWLQSANIINAN